ncbi:AAA-ATPase At3g50940-like [Rhododendron vialii]|uniref:AAA-ATPase At3g50940-like n=1 Tax=Rhododendron vialii TaxID=182163 RepID=UPI0026601C91|nr:AAA-ATPase At3g50940-like [Rhododendron vialii]
MLPKTQKPPPHARIPPILSAAASAAATAMVLRSLAKDLIPRELQHDLFLRLRRFLSRFSSELTLTVDEYDGLYPNALFQAAETYLGTVITPDTKRFRASKPEREKRIKVSVEKDEELTDWFGGVPIKWRLFCKDTPGKYVANPDSLGYEYGATTLKSESRFFELVFHKKIKDKVINEYLPYILEKSKILKEEQRTLKLWTLKIERGMGGLGGPRSKPWQSVNLDHPSTFDTLAMELDAKENIMADLQRFVKRKEFYRRVGKAWKRGYLLYGPPGTGKSSLIAAMANYLNFDVYDLELTATWSNSELRNLLISTANQSILVVEDIDCSIELQDRFKAAKKLVGKPLVAMDLRQPDQGYDCRSSGVTLSGLLNFIDGLWSSCGDERIIIFTTNHKERLDPALLRPGRMDVHIHMSYCTPCGFRMLAQNYLEISEHPLFTEIERLLKMKKVTPAEVGEQLLKNEEAESALRGLIELLEEKEVEEVKAGQVEQKESGSEGVTELEN